MNTPHITKLPETDEETVEFIRQCESGEIPEPPPFNSPKLLARMCVMQTRIDELEAECTRLHSHWHAAEEKLKLMQEKIDWRGKILQSCMDVWTEGAPLKETIQLVRYELQQPRASQCNCLLDLESDAGSETCGLCDKPFANGHAEITARRKTHREFVLGTLSDGHPNPEGYMEWYDSLSDEQWLQEMIERNNEHIDQLAATRRMINALQLIAGYDPNTMSGYECKEIAAEVLEAILPNKKKRYNDMLNGYCENCLNRAECYQSGRCWPVVDHQPDAGRLCAEMDDAFSDYEACLRCEECNVELPAIREETPVLTAAKAKNAGVWVKNFLIYGDESGYHYFCCSDHGKAWREKNIPSANVTSVASNPKLP